MSIAVFHKDHVPVIQGGVHVRVACEHIPFQRYGCGGTGGRVCVYIKEAW